MKSILTFCLISLLAFVKTGGAQISSELNMSSKKLRVRLDVLYHPNVQKKWSIYTHNLFAHNYKDNSSSFFTFNKLAYTFKSGIGFSMNLIGNTSRFYSSMGLHFDKKFKHMTLYFLTAYALNSISLNENYFIVVYRHPLGKKINLISHNDFYTSLRNWSHDLSIERFKLAIELHKTQLGFFNESVQKNGKFNLKTISFGGYIKQVF